MAKNMKIAEQLLRYLSGETNIALLRKSLMDLQIDRADELDESARTWLAMFEGYYAEYTDGLVREDFLRDRLRALLRQEASAPNAASLVLIFQTPGTENCFAQIDKVESILPYQNPSPETPLPLRSTLELLIRHA